MAVAEEALRQMQQQFTTALEGLSRKSAELQAELGTPQQQLEWTHDCWRNLANSQVHKKLGVTGVPCSRIRWRSGATIAEADGRGHQSGGTDPERYDPGGRRSGSIGTGLLDVAHDLQGCSSELRIPGREGLEAWRLLTEKYEPKMRTRIAGQLMSILSFSLQGDTAERITAWEGEIATYERDSGKVLDDEIKIGMFLLRLPESQLKTHLLMRVDTLRKWTDFKG